jgi:hypothetical protein
VTVTLSTGQQQGQQIKIIILTIIAVTTKMVTATYSNIKNNRIKQQR